MSAENYTDREFNAGVAFTYGLGLFYGKGPSWIAVAFGLGGAVWLFAWNEVLDWFAGRGSYARAKP